MPLISRKVSATESNSSQYALRKTPNEGSAIGKRKVAATNSLNTSEKGWSGSCRFPKKQCLQKIWKSSSITTCEDVSDTSNDLRLAFYSIDGKPSDQKAALNTFFHPVLSLYKELDHDTSTNCTNTTEVGENKEQSCADYNPRPDCCSADEDNLGSTRSCPHKDDSETEMPPLGTDSEDSDSKTVMQIIQTSSDLESDDLENMAESVPVSDVNLDTGLELVSADSNIIYEDVFGAQAVFDVGTDCTGWLYDVGTRDPVGIVEDEFMNSEGASLYLAVQQSRVLDDGNDQISQVDPATIDEVDSFDPYLFIKHLPDLSEVVPCRPPVLLPKEAWCSPPVTLVLDLDETLIHSTLERSEDADFTFPVICNLQEYTVYVRCRPYLQMFMERVSQMFEIIVFTASQSIYAEQLLDILDPERKWIQHRVFRDSCVLVDGNYLKDLTILGRDLSKVAIIDNSPQAFGFQVDNGIPVESWFDDKSDAALTRLLPFLETLVGVDDVRPLIAKQFNLRQKIAVAMESPCSQNML